MKSLYIFLTTLLLFVISAPVTAQIKRWEHNAYIGVGRVNRFNPEDKQTTAVHAGYGINYYLTPNWSIMPGIGVRMKAFGKDNDETGNCEAIYIDVPMIAQYHFSGDKHTGLVAECGFVFSFLPSNKVYQNTSWIPQHPFEGHKKYTNYDFGIRPGIYYETPKWRFGAQSHIGIMDVKRKYKIYSNSDDLNEPYHIFDIVATISYHW